MLVLAKGLSKRYGRDWVLRNLDFQLAEGETVALLGPNGAGKTTLLRMLAGLVRPTSGSLEVRGRVGFLSNPPAFYRHLSGLENLLYALRMEGRRADPHRVRTALERVGLPPHKPLLGYSSGMRKRLALARLALLGPEIWLLDEPETALDTEGRGLLEGMVQEARSRGGVVIATHDRGWLPLVNRSVQLGAPL
ncbi:MAG: ABC transporter ATP-binding protein [Meiothermus sp.]|uniref:ABC transporter ATP-binding protein n=1 Tax=Meiothermus sp. TaxID=1955249 RepID=UPI0025F30175|nr:ABC transporter ATP-binding protein [Meiothermus sp.]MCS7057376.1 ABC transporter ATP-binding protein [Meiothermus sp.]MCS7193619.1 ABC transporter ATP-binding protein [Meiothermus sp.]MCX7741090.1 ABC transporter ATP-binding protein [Meiothermus sp.]MDW8090633.1 ABC transporter ATP-binding protein [Meiothermus sp.]MDW8480549.1 ABC transporter ATP-binding protein [Meiothermus sp.]